MLCGHPKSRATKNEKMFYSVLFSQLVLGLGLGLVGMYFFVSFLGIWYILSQIIVKLLISIFNYYVYNSLIFNE